MGARFFARAAPPVSMPDDSLLRPALSLQGPHDFCLGLQRQKV